MTGLGEDGKQWSDGWVSVFQEPSRQHHQQRVDDKQREKQPQGSHGDGASRIGQQSPR